MWRSVVEGRRREERPKGGAVATHQGELQPAEEEADEVEEQVETYRPTDEETALMLCVEGAVSEAHLRAVSGQRDLTRVTSITLRVNTDEDPLDHLGALLPRLDQLRLTGSCISSVRDLGHSTLGALRVLWLSRCGLADLDGVGGLPCLEELYLASNRVEDVSPLAAHPALRTLDLDGNRLDEDSGALDWLATLPCLTCLHLGGNPMAEAGGYREAVLASLPRLETLDDVDTRVVPEPPTEPPAAGEAAEPRQRTRARTACGYYSGGDASAAGARSPAALSDRGSEASAGSTLTYGSDDVLCGSIVSGLRRRRRDSVARRASLRRLERTQAGGGGTTPPLGSSRAPSASSAGTVELLTPASSRSSLCLSLRSARSPSPPASPVSGMRGGAAAAAAAVSPRARRAFVFPASPPGPGGGGGGGRGGGTRSGGPTPPRSPPRPRTAAARHSGGASPARPLRLQKWFDEQRSGGGGEDSGGS